MRILIVGGAGFVGGHLARRLLDAHHIVAVFDTAILDAPGVAPTVAADLGERARRLLAGASFTRGDASDRSGLAATLARFDPDCVFYLAALPLVAQVEASPAEAAVSMTTGLTTCLELVRNRPRPVRFVYVSSSMVYGHFTADPLHEEAPTEPVNLYGGLKLAGEVLTRAYLANTIHEAVVIRPSGVYGPTDIHGRVVQKCCEAAVTGEPFIVTNSSSTLIDFTWVGDLASGMMLAATAPDAAGETFNLTFGQARSLSELIEVVSRCSDAPMRVVESEVTDAHRPRRGSLDVSKARRLLGYRPEVDLERGVASYLTFMSARLQGRSTIDLASSVPGIPA